MLAIKTTEKLTGVTVSGTYWDLNALYDALSNVIGGEGSYPEYEASRIRVLGLCYDIRHAYQGDRRQIQLHAYETLLQQLLYAVGRNSKCKIS